MINTILLKYTFDSAYRNKLNNDYDTAIYNLSFEEVFVLEEIIHYGKKNICYNYYRISNNDKFYDSFMKRMITDKDFSINKLRNINKLSQEEAYIIKVILICVAEQNNFKFKTGVDYGYDPLNSMSIQTNEDYDETIRNFVLANLIFKIVDNSPKFMKYNQYVRGQFSKESKQLIINILRENLDIENYIEREVVKFEKATKGMMLGERFFKNYATNISYYEVLGIEKKPKK